MSSEAEDIYTPRETRKEETERRRLIIPMIAAEYLDPDNPTDIDELVKKYNIPESSLYYYFDKEGISRKDQKRKSATVLKEIRKVETEELSIEAEKIGTIAIGLGGIIARRYLPMLDRLMDEGKTLEYIAEDIMQWYEMKAPMQSTEDRLRAEIETLKINLSAAYAMNLPNFRYWLRTRILERYATQLLNARLMGLKIPVNRALRAMQDDLLRLEGDIKEAFVGGIETGIKT